MRIRGTPSRHVRARQQLQHAEPLEPRRLFSNGLLDTSFNGGGRKTVSFGGAGIDEMLDVAVQADGKIVTVGYKSDSNTFGTGGDVAVARLLPSGAPDTTFGTNGVITFDWGGQIERGNAIAIAPDGGILVGGSTRATTTGAWADWFVAKLSPANGALDSTFGNAGRTVINFGGNDQLMDLVVDAQGRIVASGQANGNQVGLARLSAAGAPDATFNSSGRFAATVNNNLTDGATSLAIQNDGRIVTVQTAASNGAGGGVKTISIARFNANGGFDTSFGGGTGYVVDGVGVAFPTNVAMAPDGSYWLLAIVGTNPAQVMLFRYGTTGTLQNYTTISNGGFGSTPQGLVVQSDGKALVAAMTGTATNGFYGRTTVARVNLNGTADTTFGTSNSGLYVHPDGQDACGLAIDDKGRPVLFDSTAGGFDSEVVRLTSDGVASVTGKLYKDTDGDQVRDTGEPALSGWQVYIDLDNDSVLDQGERVVTTDANGAYKFDKLFVPAPGAGYRIQPVMQSGYGSFLGGVQAFVSFADQAMDVGDWPIFQGMGVAGNIFNDANANGVKDAGEAGLSAAGFGVYVDANSNGLPDAGETNVSPDASGNYSIAITAASTLRLRWPVAYRQTSPTNEVGRNIGYSVGFTVGSQHFGAVASTFTGVNDYYDVDRRYPTIVFDRQVRTFAAWDFHVQNLGTNQTYTAGSAIGSSGEPNKLGFSMPALPDGNYNATLAAGGFGDNSRNLLPATVQFGFFVLAGDANHDRTVDLTDFTVLAANFNGTGKTFSQGDFDYDGAVDLTDFTILASKFNFALAPPPAAALAARTSSTASPLVVERSTSLLESANL
jgi:uncharacterized delta-60 repeat protein